MLGFLGALAGGAANLIGGLFGQKSQEKINQQNIDAANLAAHNAIQWRVADAKAAGINPLAALGSSFQPSAPQLVGSDALPNAMSGMGQNLSRAAQALQDEVGRKAQLENDLLKAQTEQIKASTVSEMAKASRIALQVSPGSPPPVNVPLPRAAPHTADTLPLFQDYRDRLGNRYTLFDPEAQRSIFSGVPGAVSYPGLATAMALENARQTAPVVRGDLARIMNNLTSSSVDNPWLWQQ